MKFRLDYYISKALDQGRTVEITKADDYGYHIEIDGVPLTRNKDKIENGWDDDGLPHEMFDVRTSDSLSDEAEDLIEQIEQEFAQSKVDDTGEVPRLKESRVPTRMLKVMHDEGLRPWTIQKWMPDSVRSLDVKAAVVFSNRSEGDTE